MQALIHPKGSLPTCADDGLELEATSRPAYPPWPQLSSAMSRSPSTLAGVPLRVLNLSPMTMVSDFPASGMLHGPTADTPLSPRGLFRAGLVFPDAIALPESLSSLEERKKTGCNVKGMTASLAQLFGG